MTYRLAATTLAAILMIGCAQPQNPTAVADVNAAVERYWNRQVTIVGQVTAVQADPVGTTRGYYVLMDETDRGGMQVSSRNLPAPGQEMYVTGTVIQDPNNARQPLLQEMDRSAVGAPWLQYVMYDSGALAVVLLGTLLVTFLKTPRTDGPGSGTMTMPPAPVIPAYVDPRPMNPVGDVTQPYTPPDETQPFNFWGFGLRVEEGPDAGKTVPIGTSPFLLGRSGGRQNHLQFSDKTVSRSQAAIRRHPKTGVFTIEHQGGTNETMVDGKPVDVAELHEGTRIRCGATVLVFEKDGRG